MLTAVHLPTVNQVTHLLFLVYLYPLVLLEMMKNVSACQYWVELYLRAVGQAGYGCNYHAL
jgi:hypothetical protein